MALRVLRQSLKSPAMIPVRRSAPTPYRIDQGLGLAPAARFEQAEVDHVAVHRPFRRIQHAVQDAALLVGVVGDVVVALVGDRVGTEQSIAVMAVVVTAFMP